MKQLDKQFIGGGDVKGFIFTQIKTNGFAYIYEVDTGYSKHFEVFEHKQTKDADGVIAGVPIHFAAKITYPSSRAFGDWAYCYTSLEKAEIRYNELTEIVKQRIENQNNKPL